jgi:eukaryotic-like serine/threonine-protein kinase
MTFEGVRGAVESNVNFALAPEGGVPEGMVQIPASIAQIAGAGSVRLPPFFIDKYEVTNRQFKRFVDAGGYRTRDYWKESLIKDGRELSWDEAMAEFRDNTGRPGPATWELGTYPEGQDDYPVNGVSWYEAVAYARFAGEMLPTVHPTGVCRFRAFTPFTNSRRHSCGNLLPRVRRLRRVTLLRKLGTPVDLQRQSIVHFSL